MSNLIALDYKINSNEPLNKNIKIKTTYTVWTTFWTKIII